MKLIGPTRCVASEQRALGPAQHFHAVEVEQAHALARTRGDIDVVDIDADWRCWLELYSLATLTPRNEKFGWVLPYGLLT